MQLMDIHAYRTYSLRRPPGAVSKQRITCEQASCEGLRNGWVTRLNLTLDEHREAHAWIMAGRSGKRFIDITKDGDAPIVSLLFASGQECFATHVRRVDWEPLYIVRDGDARGNPTGWGRRHVKSDHWVEDCAENQDKLADLAQRG